ncbi:guanine deaminase [Toxorhynchites rutilus septentrionalis]|uniref:guanine deaminase n=1 Tax=Toxorhynchites rutilus septentrionalis TaxID=329112 RepID=UPI00247A51BA|nr:guanine deaminase [Toxorhynchites rutilus septentrionalis]
MKRAGKQHMFSHNSSFVEERSIRCVTLLDNSAMRKVFFGKIVHSKSFDELEVIADGFLAVRDGKIVDIGARAGHESLPERDSYEPVTLAESQFLLPGFIDCHIHAPQCPNIGLGMDKDLLGWLNAYTFPLEAQYRDGEFARQVYSAVVRDTIASGTTCACYFATIYNESNKVLTEEIIRQGQRAFVGKVSSNRLCPDYYVESSTETSIRDNIDFIEFVLSKNVDRVKPIITPRFAITCDMELMKKLAELAKRYELNITSHISESIGEIKAIGEFYPEHKHYTDVYDDAKLMTSRCLMAHGVHLKDTELKVFSARGSSVAHCPTSNTCLGSGLCDVKRLLAAKVKVGLGTDVSGGNRMGIYDVMRSALDVSHHLSMMKKQDVKGTGKVTPVTKENEEYTPMNYKQVVYLATLGGAEALSIEEKVGNFAIGKDFDALLIDTSRYPITNYQLPAVLTEKKSPEELLLEQVQKFVYVGDDRNIANVFVAGQQVK